MKVSIIIPNYNGKDLLANNLPKVIKYARGAEIIVVDDASSDDSVNMLKKNFPNVKIIEISENKGFAGAVNVGIRNSTGDLVLLLNSDVAPEEDFINLLISHFKSPTIFAVGCLQIGDKEISHGRGIGKFQRGFLIHSKGNIEKKNTLWVFAGAGIFRKDIWLKLGGLEEIYNPFYWEDIDLSFRALKSGYKLLFEPDAKVKHIQASGSIRTNYSQFDIDSIAYRNQILFVWLNITDKDYLLQHMIFLPYHLIKSLFTLDFAFIYGFFLALLKLHPIYSKRNRHIKLFTKTDQQVLSAYQE